MADIPDQLTLSVNRDREGRRDHVLRPDGATQNDFSVTGAMLAAGTMALMTILFSWLNFRFPRVQPIERNLKRNRITLEELAAQVRLKDIAHISDVEWAVLETSGQITFIKKSS